MAAVPIQIDGVIYPQERGGSVPRPMKVTIIGSASIFGLTIGGGPIIPPDLLPPQGPVDPGYSPPWAQVPEVPTHPIVIPPEPPIPPIDELPGVPDPVPPNTVLKPAPASGGWALISNPDSSLNWVYDPAPPSGAGPKR